MVAKLEQFEVELPLPPRNRTPSHILKNVPNSRALVGRSRVVGSTSVLDFIESMRDSRVTYVGILSTISSENGSKAMEIILEDLVFVFFFEKKSHMCSHSSVKYSALSRRRRISEESWVRHQW